VRYAFPHLYSEELSLEEERNQIKVISKEKIMNVARKTFVPEVLNLILVGPYTSKLKAELEKLIFKF
jgi:hypothetical protein